jgi:hypothetical protein
MAGKYNITIDQGSTFNFQFTVKTSGTPWNLTSYTARMQIRSSVEAKTALLSLTNGSGITLGGALGTVAVTISATQTAALLAGKHVWDIELVSAGGEVSRILEGKATVKAEVTR